MENTILGLHHITAIADSAQKNLDFYTKVLGQRLVKKTVNFDDPGTYHFYFGNETGEAGTILTFFPWQGIPRGHTGTGMATNIAYAIANDSLAFWRERFGKMNVKHGEIEDRFGETVLPFEDPDGLQLELVVPAAPDQRVGWTTTELNNEVALKGFNGVTLTVRNMKGTAKVLTDIFGYSLEQQENSRYRFVTKAVGHAAIVDIVETPVSAAGKSGAGTNHHVAFRVKDEQVLMDFRETIAARGFNITPKIDRDYFFSLYFREPGGVLFEIATDNPGFTRDEPLDQLGTSLKLPRQYENGREEIERSLPAIVI